MALHSAIKGKLISVIGDEDTCVGFLLGGVGEINKNRHPNFMVVDKTHHNNNGLSRPPTDIIAEFIVGAQCIIYC
ncbi:V-type proton ATPase subunit F 1 isoform X2 [Drosophila montana]|uniref:V-type proton ATPase subunit F 1 isoform X2 n=1 Tax=Drosophila montana TaxID=40370 RepID=UPI00313E84A5